MAFAWVLFALLRMRWSYSHIPKYRWIYIYFVHAVNLSSYLDDDFLAKEWLKF